MRKTLGISCIALLTLLAHAAAAYGAHSSPTDPSAGSPAGAEYQLPFEKGRQDAAPKGTGGTSAPGGPSNGGGGGPSGTGGGSGSTSAGEPDLYRSENDFGSASKVPGARPGEDGVPVNGGGAHGEGAASNGASAPAGSSGGSGDPGAGPALDVGRLTHSGNTSSAANIGLLVLIALVAAGVGVVSARSARLRRSRT